MKKTKLIIPARRPTNARSVMKFGQYTFRWTKDLEPIPVEVPEKAAKYLLSMERGCRCRHRDSQPMFKEVQRSSN